MFSSVPTLANAQLSDPSFTGFENVEDTDVDLLNDEVARPTHWWQRNTFWYILDHAFGQFTLNSLWRFPTLALALSIDWNTERLGLLDFLIPYAVVLALVAWPMLVAELGIAQVTKGSGPRAFGSLGVNTRAAGLSWLLSLGICVFMSAFASYCVIFALESNERGAAYYTSRVRESATAKRACIKFGAYVPEMQPMLCQSVGNRFDVSCFEEDNCQLWSGNGRCMAVPWAPAADYVLSNADEVDPLLDNDYPQYCGARVLHDVTTGAAPAVMTRDAGWSDYGSKFNWKLCMAFLIVWGLALGISFSGKAAGNAMRIGISLFGLAVSIVVFVCLVVWFGKNKWSGTHWLRPMCKLHPYKLIRPEVWANALVQACFSLGLGTNQIPTISGRAPNEKHNITLISSAIICINVAISYGMLWIVYLAYAAATSQDIGIMGDDAMAATIKYDIRNMPFGQLWSSLQTAFDNSGDLDGSSPRSWVVSFLFWIAAALFGVNGLTQSFEAVLEPIYKSSMNWTVGLGRWIWLLILTVFFIACSIIFWWGPSWGFAVILQHFFLNFALPLTLLYQSISIGWLFGWESRLRHFGKTAFFVQIATFFVGVLIAAIPTAALHASENVTARWISFFFGVLIMVCAVFLPAFLQRDHDIYGRKHLFNDKLHLTVFGYTEHLRKELNYITCHTHRFWKLTKAWTLLIRYVCPFACVLAWSTTIVNSDQNWAFSPYRPFLNEHNDVFSHVERALVYHDLIRAPPGFIAVGWLLSLLIVIAIPVFFFFPYALDWMVPPGTDPNFFDVKRAVELFASSKAQEQVPVRFADAETRYSAPTTPSERVLVTPLRKRSASHSRDIRTRSPMATYDLDEEFTSALNQSMKIDGDLSSDDDLPRQISARQVSNRETPTPIGNQFE